MSVLLPRRRLYTNVAALGKATGGGGGYIGPGDISAASWWGGLRGYSSAYSTGSNAAIDIVDQAGANLLTVNVLSNGTLDVASIATWVSVNSVTTIKVTKLYDQSGGGLHGVQATLAAMPVLVLGPITGLASNRPSLQFAGAQAMISSNRSAGTLNQPFTLSTVSNRTGNTAAFQGIMALGNAVALGFDSTARVVSSAGGASAFGVSAANNAWHSFQGVFNGANCLVNTDGIDGSIVNGGTGAWATGSSVWFGEDSFGNTVTGNIQEGGVFPTNFTTSGANLSGQMNTNQKTYWGY